MNATEEILFNQLQKLYKEIILPEEQRQMRYEVSKRIEKIISDEYPNYMFNAVIYGSTEYGLCLVDSDLDLCLNSMFTEVNSSMMQTFAELLKQHNFQIELVLPKARTPIIKMIDLETNIHIDLSFNQNIPIIHTEFFSTMVRCNAHFKPVTVILKQWLKTRNLNCSYKGGMSSAVLYFMVIHYFISLDPPLFPNDFIQCIFPIVPFNASRISLQTINKYSTAYLVKGFFEYYKSFDWDEMIIPTTVQLQTEDMIIPGVITVVDPVTFENCARSLSEDGLRTFKLEVERAFRILNEENDFDKVLENPLPFPQ